MLRYYLYLTCEGFVYLISIMDLYSRKIISWVLSDTLKAADVVECIEKAKKHRKIDKPLIFHCDYAEKTKTFTSYTA